MLETEFLLDDRDENVNGNGDPDLRLANQWMVFLTTAPTRRNIEEAGFRFP